VTTGPIYDNAITNIVDISLASGNTLPPGVFLSMTFNVTPEVFADSKNYTLSYVDRTLTEPGWIPVLSSGDLVCSAGTAPNTLECSTPHFTEFAITSIASSGTSSSSTNCTATDVWKGYSTLEKVGIIVGVVLGFLFLLLLVSLIVFYKKKSSRIPNIEVFNYAKNPNYVDFNAPPEVNYAQGSNSYQGYPEGSTQ
jgi:hypothetical protein